MSREMNYETLEMAYEALAQAIDKAGPKNETLLLAKMVILLTQKGGDLDVFSEALRIAQKDLPPAD